MPIVVRKTAGGVILGRRRVLGLLSDDIVLGRQQSTLRRFEKAETTLSFGGLVLSSGTMAVLVQSLLGSMNDSLTGTNRHNSLWFSWYDMVTLKARGQDVDSATDVINRTMKYLKDVPDKIRTGQLFVLTRAAMEVGFNHFDESETRTVA